MSIEQKSFRTYKRRSVTRKSGFKVSGETTGGQCKIIKSSRHYFYTNRIVLIKKIDTLELVQLFKREVCILAFSIYMKPSDACKVSGCITYELKDELVEKDFIFDVTPNIWNSVGSYVEIPKSVFDKITNVVLSCKIELNQAFDDKYVDIYGFNFDILDYPYFFENDVYDSFKSKTHINIPYLFYFSKNDIQIDSLVDFPNELGDLIVLKSCNRCSRYLPINIENEANTLAFSLHCKKRAPCNHSTFSSYEINVKEGFIGNIKDNRLISYYGHQLECKSCKKFFVNAPLNPQRNAQQFKEDGLRRRAFEVLVNTLLNQNLVHHEYKKKTKNEFTEHIYNKFGGVCFKCGKSLTMNEMNLDHTLPLAYLYRLDETATSLCDTHNSSKSDRFPIEFYDEKELIKLSEITGLSLGILKTKSVNMRVIELLAKNVVWFFDTFLMHKDYQKIRAGRLTADKIYQALVKVIPDQINLVELYLKETGDIPKSITIE